MTNSFHPPVRTLMGPGPSDVNPRILEALSRPTIGHLDPAFIEMMDEIKELLQFAFQTSNKLTLPVSAPGSAGMETVFANLLEPGDQVVVCQNGVFGGRMKENVERCGAEAIMVEDEWGCAVDLDKVEQVLQQNPEAKALAFVHAETSTGVRSDAEALCGLSAKYDCLSIVDAVTSLGGIDINVDAWGVDAIYSGTQKCLSCVPGLSPVSFSDRAAEVIRNRKTRVQSWFLDLNLVMGYWGSEAKRSYHHTAPVNSLYALHESLVILREEGLQNSWDRHHANHLAFVAGIEALGLKFVVDEEYRLPQLNAVSFPSSIDDAAVRSRLLSEYDLEIGAGLGTLAGSVWRIGLMGYASNKTNVRLCLSALGNILSDMGMPCDTAKAVKAASTLYSNS
ncbi:MAG: alanine--glyoxylate aminotransferase family protein [Gammaproteobacteria bacterium]|nr:alanine--glyoxylate aminotransferase family protein [Gammaproteobacteria bacterium]MBT3860603.1 alanine--glyoxylate aminotransferase family protein [Gammaproteobacteria bacterium]MBT3988740.1 alanine--glyoxylate aminotransferase family protein [Gammaproteobacteria bacterium]MBT4255756.1 alanine--glyoxylate aminotransferase family protein [Gammaproteobacteria bacterium]MBT4582603.1 alanine--glyoxylate aminotransferase family protein [Gammaproteobacteria bacterium]